MAKRTNSKKSAAERAYEEAKRTSKPGEGRRFKALNRVLATKGARNPDALAAWIGQQKYGKKRFQQMAAAGRRRKKKVK